MMLKQLRALKGVTQKEVGEAIGCSEVVYSRYENSIREPSLDTLIKLADYFETSVDELLGHQVTRIDPLSDYEIELIVTSRRADERARLDALTMLKTHMTAPEKGNLA